LDAVNVPDSSYLALRQGGFTLAERGDTRYAVSAERMATPVAGTGLRVAAGLPPPAPALLGLGPMPSFVVAGLLLLLAFLMSRLPALVGSPQEEDAGDAPTLEEALESGPESGAAPGAEPGAAPGEATAAGAVARAAP